MAGYKFYHYDPSMAAGAIFVILFSIATIRHFQLLFRKRCWYFIPFIIGCLCKIIRGASAVLHSLTKSPSLVEAAGYVGRCVSASESPDWTLYPYLVQSLLLLLGPTFYAASIYMILGRLIRLLEADSYSLIRTTWLTKFFLVGDVLSFMSQSAGM